MFSVRKWLYIHLTGQVFVVLWACHFYHAIIAVFIPITGRSGGHKNPDVTIGIISCFFTMFIGSYLVSLNQQIYSSSKPMFLIRKLPISDSISWIAKKSQVISSYSNFIVCTNAIELHWHPFWLPIQWWSGQSNTSKTLYNCALINMNALKSYLFVRLSAANVSKFIIILACCAQSVWLEWTCPVLWFRILVPWTWSKCWENHWQSRCTRDTNCTRTDSTLSRFTILRFAFVFMPSIAHRVFRFWISRF